MKASQTNFKEYWDTHSINGNPIGFYANHPDVDEEQTDLVMELVNGEKEIDREVFDWLDEPEEEILVPLYFYLFAHLVSIEGKGEIDHEDCAIWSSILLGDNPEQFWTFFLNKENELQKKAAWRQIVYSMAWDLSNTDEDDEEAGIEANKTEAFEEWREASKSFSEPIKQVVEKFIEEVDHSISMQW